MGNYLTYFDMFRYICGVLLVIIMLCHGIIQGRPHYKVRLALCCIAALLAALAYVPMSVMMTEKGISLLPASVVYWILMSTVPVIVIRVCWQASWAGILFRASLCASVEIFMTSVGYYLFTKALFPDLSVKYPFLFMVAILLLYTLILMMGWFLLRPFVSVDENEFYERPDKTAAIYLYVYISVCVLYSAAKLCLELEIIPLKEQAEFLSLYTFLQYYLILSMVLFSAAFTFIMINAFQVLTLQNEKQIITQILRERENQYEFSKENSELLKQMAHNFKHQLRAMDKVSDQERKERIAEAEKSVDFYDAMVKTGNEALDTILTEKSIYCRNRGIRLSCMVSSTLLDKIGVVDLYTLLGNALDNSIEAVEKLSDPDKKTISLIVRDQNQMLYMQLENYYEGRLIMEDGLPQTTKEDAQYHGYGTRSIRSIVKRYSGVVRVRTEDQVFSLEILIPT